MPAPGNTPPRRSAKLNRSPSALVAFRLATMRRFAEATNPVLDNLAATAFGVGSASAALTVQEHLVASAVGVGKGAAALTVTHNLSAAAVGIGSGAAILSDSHRLSAAGIGVGRAAASLTVTAAAAPATTADHADADLAEIRLGQPEIPPGGFDRYLHVERLRTEGRIRAAQQAEMEPLALMLLAADAISEEEWALLVAA